MVNINHLKIQKDNLYLTIVQKLPNRSQVYAHFRNNIKCAIHFNFLRRYCFSFSVHSILVMFVFISFLLTKVAFIEFTPCFNIETELLIEIPDLVYYYLRLVSVIVDITFYYFIC